MKLTYVAGPFSAATRAGVEDNIMRAALVGVEVAKVGGFPVVPHSNTSHPLYEQVQQYPFWIAATMAMLRKCDAVMLVSGWEESSGARGERKEALRLGMPIFLPGDYDGLSRWLEWGGTVDPFAPEALAAGTVSAPTHELPEAP